MNGNWSFCYIGLVQGVFVSRVATERWSFWDLTLGQGTGQHDTPRLHVFYSVGSNTDTIYLLLVKSASIHFM